MKKDRKAVGTAELEEPSRAPERARHSMVVPKARREPASGEGRASEGRPSARPLPLYCPFDSGLNPHASSVQLESVEWAIRVGLIREGQAARLEESKIAWLEALVFHSAPREVLRLAADWTTLFCLLDDCIEGEGLGPVDLAAYLAEALGGFRGTKSGPADGIGNGLADLSARLSALAGERFVERFAHQLAELFGAFIWEEINRRKGIRPGYDAYRTMRAITVGLFPQFLLGELALGVELPEWVRDQASLRRLETLSALAVGWANDIFTVEKELRAGEVHNLVLVLMETDSLSLHEATRRTAAEHDDAVRSFLSARAALPRAVSEDETVKVYVGMLGSWIRGHLDWARRTGRYRARAER